MHQQRLGGHDHTSGAVAALDGGFLHKVPLDAVQLPVFRQSLNGQDTAALQLAGQHQTGMDRFPVDDDGAGAAFSFAAAFLGPGHVEILPEEIQQPLVRSHLQGSGLSI